MNRIKRLVLFWADMKCLFWFAITLTALVAAIIMCGLFVGRLCPYFASYYTVSALLYTSIFIAASVFKWNLAYSQLRSGVCFFAPLIDKLHADSICSRVKSLSKAMSMKKAPTVSISGSYNHPNRLACISNLWEPEGVVMVGGYTKQGNSVINAGLAHELAHIKRRDSVQQALIGFAFQGYLACSILSISAWLYSLFMEPGSFLWLRILLDMFAVLIALVLAESRDVEDIWNGLWNRSSEYRADLHAVAATDSPAGLSEILQDSYDKASDEEKAEGIDYRKAQWLSPKYLMARIRSSHPPVEKRIDRIMRFARL